LGRVICFIIEEIIQVTATITGTIKIIIEIMPITIEVMPILTETI